MQALIDTLVAAGFDYLGRDSSGNELRYRRWVGEPYEHDSCYLDVMLPAEVGALPFYVLCTVVPGSARVSRLQTCHGTEGSERTVIAAATTLADYLDAQEAAV